MTGNPHAELVELIADREDADLLFFSGPLFHPADLNLCVQCRERKRRRNVILLLTTPGGSPEAAYRIGRCLQRAYGTYRPNPDERGRVVIFIDTFCKSAGTILALAADELVMSQLAELGPIDVQLRKPDEVGERTSGLTPTQSLETLQRSAASTFRHLFREMRFGIGTPFPTRLAAEIASSMTTGLLAPIYGQIDPMRLGEIERYVRIAAEYGDRLATSNVKTETISKLVAQYPSHEFAIDRREARALFEAVRNPDDELESLGAALRGLAITSMSADEPEFGFLNTEPVVEATRSAEVPEEEITHAAAKVDHGSGGEPKAKAGRQVRPDHGESTLSKSPDGAAAG